MSRDGIICAALCAFLLAGCAESNAPPATVEPPTHQVEEPLSPLPENVTLTGLWAASGPSVSMGNAATHEFTLDRNTTIGYSISTATPTLLEFQVWKVGGDREVAYFIRGNVAQPLMGAAELPPGNYEAWGIMRIGALTTYEYSLTFSEPSSPSSDA